MRIPAAILLFVLSAHSVLAQSTPAKIPEMQPYAAQIPVAQVPTNALSVAKTAGIGTTGVLVSAADATNRRTVRNTGSVACEIMPSAAAYGAGHPLPVGESFTFDASGRTTAALYVACASAGGSVSVISY